MKILCIGDIFGKPGRDIVKKEVSSLRMKYGCDFVIANVENASHGKGVTKSIIEELQQAGVDAFTTGNHVWDNKDIFTFIHQTKNLLRPCNYPRTSPGRGVMIFDLQSGGRLAVINIEGQRGMNNSVDSPFACADREVTQLKGRADIIILDFHTETTSEKRTMGWYLDGRISAIVGTHTHVQTADEEILPKGTAYISDLGMTGPYHSVIGLKKESAIQRFVNHLPAPFEVGEGDTRLCGVVIDIDERTGKSRSIERIQIRTSE